MARKIWVLLELLRNGRVRLSEYQAIYHRDYRSFQRDLQHLRRIGASSGFKISKIGNNETARLESYDKRVGKLDGSRDVVRLVAEIARALGEPIASRVVPVAEQLALGEERFLHVRAPRLVEGSRVAKIYDRLEAAWRAEHGRAYVRFRYRDPKTGRTEERLVDPHGVIVRSGRYYLVGYDNARHGWRFFALDAFATLPDLAGTCHANRKVPADYDSDDAIGFIKGGPQQAVTVEFSKALAASATSREWQKGQVIDTLPDGRARMTFRVADPREVIRWTFGFGGDARVVAPPSVVAEANDMAGRLVLAHHLDARAALQRTAS
jgi:predicted DNA-binding transcriptional regulator YafY